MKLKLLYLAIAGIMAGKVSAQDFVTNNTESKYQFTIEKKLDVTPVKNQNKSGTCWSFSTSSFLESEVIRIGKAPVDLSMMWVVRNMYYEKAWNYLRRQGKAQFAEGGEPHDVLNCIRKYGIVPKSVYTGENSSVDGKPIHGEMDAVLASFMKTIAEKPTVTKNWSVALNGILDAYLGKKVDTFSIEGKKFTPVEYANSLGINPDDYVEITSFTHHPFYKPFVLEISDNWDNGMAYNVPLDDLQAIADNAIKTGYTIEWASDVSEKYFSFKNSIAIVPEGIDTMADATLQKTFLQPGTEKTITQEMRQEAFDNLTTTDDHGMHIVGKSHDQNNHEFYLVKNSWGTDRNAMKGYFYCSVPYFRYKTTAIMVHKGAIPESIAMKLGLVKLKKLTK